MAAIFSTYDYEMTHGRKPRGTGSWAFAPAGHDYGPEEIPEDGLVWEWGRLSDAKRDVARRFPSVSVWTVLP